VTRRQPRSPIHIAVRCGGRDPAVPARSPLVRPIASPPFARVPGRWGATGPVVRRRGAPCQDRGGAGSLPGAGVPARGGGPCSGNDRTEQRDRAAGVSGRRLGPGADQAEDHGQEGPQSEHQADDEKDEHLRVGAKEVAHVPQIARPSSFT
jgi:hypothetical protein